jgi:hypothetical protein
MSNKEMVALVGGEAGGRSYIFDCDQNWMGIKVTINGSIIKYLWYLRKPGDSLAYFMYEENKVYDGSETD